MGYFQGTFQDTILKIRLNLKYGKLEAVIGVKMHIVILEDDEAISYSLVRYFVQRGHQTEVFETLKQALASDFLADFYLVDISLPDGLGYEFTRALREVSNAPLIYLTVKDDQKSIIEGFDSGADDYLMKPFTFEELESRIKALMKRVQPKVFTKGDLKIFVETALVTYKNQEIHLSVQEYRILLLLFQNLGQIVSREYLNKVLGIDETYQDNTLNVAIGRLRKKLKGMIEIEAVFKQGYRITP